MNLPEEIYKEQQGENFVAFFLSDLHLSLNNPAGIVTLETWLQELATQKPAHIFFQGDVFDLWVGTASPVKLQVQGVLQKLKNLQNLGFEIFFFEGNHDLHLDVYFEKKWGFRVIKDFYEIELSGVSFKLEHGDLFNPNDSGYLFLRRFLRLGLIRFFLLYLIPDFVINKVGHYFSQKSSKKTKKIDSLRIKKVSELLQAYAQSEFEQKNYDVLICGHTHQKEALEFESGKILINLGTWQWQKENFHILAFTKDQKLKWLKI